MTNKLIKKYDIMISIVMVPVDRFLRFSKILPFYRNVIMKKEDKFYLSKIRFEHATS